MSARLSGKIKNEKRPSKKRGQGWCGGGAGFSSFELTERIIIKPRQQRTSALLLVLLLFYTLIFLLFPHLHFSLFLVSTLRTPLVHLHRIAAPSALARRIYLGISVPVDPGHHARSTLEGLN